MQGVVDGNSFRWVRRYRRYIFLSLSAAYLISYFHRSAVAVAGPEIMKDLALTPASLGLLGSMYFWAYAATALPAGLLADTWGARKTIALFVFLAGIGGILFTFAPSLPMLASGRFVIGLGVGVVYVAAMRILSDWYEPDEIATFSGILLAVGNVGALISTTPLVFIMSYIGWRGAFGLVAGLTLAVSILAFKLIRNKPAEVVPLILPRTAGSHSFPDKQISLTEAIRVVLGNRNFYLLAILLFSYYGSFMGVGSLWAGPYLRQAYGLSGPAAANVLMMFPLAMVLGCPIAGYISDKIIKTRKIILLGGSILHVLCYFPLVFLGSRATVIFLYVLFLWYGLTGGAFVVCFACVKEIYQPRFAGTAVGALNIALFTGGAFYQYVMGAVIGKYATNSPGVYPVQAFQSAFAVPMCGLIAGMILFAFFFREKPAKTPEICAEAVGDLLCEHSCEP